MGDSPAILAAKKYLQGAGPWKLDEISIGEDDYLVRCFDEAIKRERTAIVEWLLADDTGRGLVDYRHCWNIASMIQLGAHEKP